jgi:hypothetical protein
MKFNDKKIHDDCYFPDEPREWRTRTGIDGEAKKGIERTHKVTHRGIDGIGLHTMVGRCIVIGYRVVVSNRHVPCPFPLSDGDG